MPTSAASLALNQKLADADALLRIHPAERQQHLDHEPDDAASVRSRLNERIRGWVGGRFDGLSAAQVLQWRAIVVEERLNVSLSPWKESNVY